MFLVFELGRPKGDLRSRGRDEDLAFFFSEESRSSSEGVIMKPSNSWVKRNAPQKDTELPSWPT